MALLELYISTHNIFHCQRNFFCLREWVKLSRISGVSSHDSCLDRQRLPQRMRRSQMCKPQLLPKHQPDPFVLPLAWWSVQLRPSAHFVSFSGSVCMDVTPRMVLPSRPAVILAIKGDRAAHTMGDKDANGRVESCHRSTLNQGNQVAMWLFSTFSWCKLEIKAHFFWIKQMIFWLLTFDSWFHRSWPCVQCGFQFCCAHRHIIVPPTFRRSSPSHSEPTIVTEETNQIQLNIFRNMFLLDWYRRNSRCT